MKTHFPGDMTLIGDFEMSTPIMRVSDPCYDRDVWCCGTVDNCKLGIWEAGVLYQSDRFWGTRIAVLAARHKDTGPDFTAIRQNKIYRGCKDWLEQPIDVGVDSGQAGLFDDVHYQDDSVFKDFPAPEHDFGDLWYDYVCDLTLSKQHAGVLPFGAAASSGYGDGSYTCYTHENKNGEIDFAFIVFIDE